MYAVNRQSRRTAERYATYAVCKLADGASLTFRVGEPTDLATQDKRYLRLDARLTGWNVSQQRGTHHVPAMVRPVTIRHDGRKLKVAFFEMRRVDANGKGLGRMDHANAFTVPYRAVRSAK